MLILSNCHIDLMIFSGNYKYHIFIYSQFKCKTVLFDPYIEPYRVLTLWARVNQRMMAMRGRFPKLHHYWNLTIRWFSVISRTLIGELLLFCRAAVSLSQLGQLYQVLSLWARLDLGVVAMKRHSAFPKAPVLLEPHHQIVQCYILETHWGTLTPQQRYTQCILQPQLTGLGPIRE